MDRLNTTETTIITIITTLQSTAGRQEGFSKLQTTVKQLEFPHGTLLIFFHKRTSIFRTDEHCLSKKIKAVSVNITLLYVKC